ncbi:MAG TPA: hypothetical protein PJ982_17875, partial [Lacipirellulaceae bacterium]|nr:hypothetical protein [Lacipirellulaceae bacterium]
MSRILLAAMILAGCSAHAWAQQGDAAGDETAAAVAAEAGQTETQADANADAADEAPPREVSPAAAAAQAAFEDLVAQWHNKVAQLRVLQGDRDKAQGESRAALDRQMAGLRAEIAELLDTIVTQGLEVYRADADAFPEINATLLAIAQFYIVGDAQGDGGDQYEKALPLIKSMIDMGAAKKWPQLYTAGGMAAYSIGELDLAEQYLKSAQAA